MYWAIGHITKCPQYMNVIIQDLCWTLLITSHVLYINSLEVQKKMLWSNLVSNAVIYVGKKIKHPKLAPWRVFPAQQF